MNETNKHTINDKELEILALWNEKQIFEKSLEHPASLDTPRGSFSFYDGPPFATGMPHHGHILAGTIKDMIPRYQTMRGNYVRRIWGWDCHGLPVENLIEKKLGLNHKREIEEYGIDKFNEEAKNSVLEYEHEWKKIVPRLGRFIDMEHAYKTMDASYTESIWWSFSELYKKGLAYEGHKIMHVCTRCETSLAQSEVALGYKDVTDISVTVKLELIDEPGTFLLAWTTTPWTLPGNVAAAVKQDAEYTYFSMEGDTHVGNTYVVASERITYATKGAPYTALRTVVGSELVGKKYIPAFNYYKDTELENKENIWKVWHADFVTMDTGTGIVHEAPAFGAEDMELAKKLSLPVIKHVRMDGTFTPEVSDFQGLYVKQKGDTQSTDIEIIKKLAHTGKLFAKEKLIHSYPHCWRCDTPLLNYATSSWFVDVPKLKEKLISENQKIGWVPEHIKDGRFGKWLEGAREWAVSRSRYWGAPLPVWKCAECDKVEVIGSLEELGSKLTAHNTYGVMRHGECVGNTEDLADSGKNIDNHLTEKGRADTLAEAQRLLSEGKPDIIISSPLLRAQETTHILKEALGLPDEAVLTDDRLREFAFGAHDGKKFDEFWDEMRYLHYHFDATMQGSESYRGVQERMLSVIFDSEKKYQGKKILLVTHGGPMWMLIAGAKHMSDDQARAYRQEMKKIQGPRYFLPNARVVDLEYVPFPNNGKALDFHRPHIDEVTYACSCGSSMKRIPDVFDCWYESGSMPFAQLHYPFENKELFAKMFPAEFIAEGMDQTRGWFYSLINLSVGLFDVSSYKHVVVNGLVLASDGQKMSKKLKNYTDPLELVEKYGADALRYYMISSPIVRGENLSFSDQDLGEVYRKVIVRLENVLSFYHLFTDNTTKPDNQSTHVLDKWILSRLNSVVQEATVGLDAYELDKAVKGIDGFVDDLSTWYLRRSRDRMKDDTNLADKQAALATLSFVLREFAKVIAPVMPFLAERLYLGVPHERESVHLESWPIAGSIDEVVIGEMSMVREFVTHALEARTKSGIKVRQPLASLGLNIEMLPEYLSIIADEVNVKEVIYEAAQTERVVLDTTITPELQKEGDVREIMRAIQDLRKQQGYTPKDTPSLLVHVSDPSFILEFSEQIQTSCSLAKILITDVALEDVGTIIVGGLEYKMSLQ